MTSGSSVSSIWISGRRIRDSLRFIRQGCQSRAEAPYRQRYAAGRELRYCLDARGQAILPEVAPTPSDPVVDKVRASGFFNTRLDTILRCAGIQTIVLTGVATDSCVPATAIDATARDYYIVVASYCVASFDAARHAAAFQILAFKHPTATSSELAEIWKHIPTHETNGERDG